MSGFCLLLLSCVVLHNVIKAHEHRTIMNALSELRPNVKPPAQVEYVITDLFPDGVTPPPWDLGNMFVPPRVVEHSNSWQRLISADQFVLEVSLVCERNGAWLADLKSPHCQSVFPAMRSGDHFFHTSERFYVSSVTSNSVTIQGLQNDRMVTLPFSGASK